MRVGPARNAVPADHGRAQDRQDFGWPPYFNAVFVPIMVPVLLLIAVVPLARWKQTQLIDLLPACRARLRCRCWRLGGFPTPWAAGRSDRAGNRFCGMDCHLVHRATGATLEVWLSARDLLGMQLGHLGVAVFVLGVTMVGGFQQEQDVRMEPGDTVVVAGYQFTMEGVQTVQGPNYSASQGAFDVGVDGKVSPRSARKNAYASSAMPMTEAAIDAGFLRDVYVSLGEPWRVKAWAVRVYYKPFVDWIWGGCWCWPSADFSPCRTAATACVSKALASKAAQQRSQRMKAKFLIPLALFVVLVGFLAVGLGLDPRVPSPLVNKPAPAFKAHPTG